MTFIKNMWYVAAWSHELGDGVPIGRMIAGERVALYRDGDGKPIAIEDRCPHRHAPLSLGRVEGDAIRCMYHGLKFGRDGRCTEMPGAAAVPPNAAARVFPLVERSSWIWVWTGDPDQADADDVPHAPGLDDPDWILKHGALDYAADYQLLNDNLCDLSHLDFVHATTLGAATGTQWSYDQPKVKTLDNGLLIERWFVDHFLQPGGPERGDTFNSYRYLLPGVFIMRTSAYPPGTAAASGYQLPNAAPVFERVEQQAVTPIAKGRSRYLFASGVGARYASPALLEGMFQVVEAAFAEDKRMIEAQQLVWDDTPCERQMTFIPQDKAPAIFRRLISKRLAEEAGSESEESRHDVCGMTATTLTGMLISTGRNRAGRERRP